MADDRPDRRNGTPTGLFVILILLFLLPVLYLLSCGPAVALINRGYLSQENFDTAYFPLQLASRNSRWIRDSLEDYARLWALRERNFGR